MVGEIEDPRRSEPSFLLGEREKAARTAAAARTLDDTGVRKGSPCSLRWIYTHMIEEYARHNGHADIIRELIDGDVGC